MKSYLPLIQKDSITHIHGLGVYVKDELPFAKDLSLENSANSYLCIWLALLHSVSYFYFLCQSTSLSLCMVFYSISSNTDEILLINSPANVFVFRDFNIHHKDSLTYSGETDKPGELCYNFNISNDLTQMVNFPPWIHYCDSQSYSSEFIYFFWCWYLFYNGFSSIGKFWSCCCLSFHWLSNKLKTRCSISSHSYDYSCADWDDLHDHLRDVPWDDIIKPSPSAATSEFCEWVQVEIDVYIPHRKYQVKPQSSPWFSSACAGAIVQRNHFFFFLPTA